MKVSIKILVFIISQKFKMVKDSLKLMKLKANHLIKSIAFNSPEILEIIKIQIHQKQIACQFHFKIPFMVGIKKITLLNRLCHGKFSLKI
jgi:hypothetical protein